jgi:hypothetical protein
MRRAVIMLSLGVLLSVSCEKSEQKTQVSGVSFTSCQQGILEGNNLSDEVDVEFIRSGVKITHYNFAVTCDFTSVNVTHNFANGVLSITQQGFPNQTNCICYTDVSYTITGISQNEVNAIFINGVQVYRHNDNGSKEGYVTFGANYHLINCPSKVTIFLDGENIGTLQRPVNAIFECGEEENITKKILAGNHTYRVEIQGCGGKNFTGAFTVPENECRKIFIDYYQIFGNQSKCNQDVVISQTEYENAPNHPLSIIDMKIVDNCLKIKFGASGCTGNNWTVKLIDLGTVAESISCQRTLRLSLEHIGDCAAYFENEMSFNIEDLQIQGDHRVQLNISGKSILYEY